jgi:hypothetical protein
MIDPLPIYALLKSVDVPQKHWKAAFDRSVFASEHATSCTKCAVVVSLPKRDL